MNVIEKFNSIALFLEAIENRPQRKNFHGCVGSNAGSKSFTKTESYDEAVKLIRDGWHEPLKDFKAVKKSNMAYTPQRKTISDVIGHAPIVPNAIQGLPNSMIRTKKVPQKVKTIEIIYNNSVLGNVKARDMVRAGKAVLSYIRKLELEGCRVKLTGALKGSNYDGHYHIVSVKLKDYKEQMDLLKLAFPMAHPSAMRRLGFRWYETNPDLVESYDYGCSIDNEKTFRDVYQCDKNAKVLLAMNMVGLSDEAMLEYIKTQIETQK